ncbi:MAG: PilW family protein [Acidobacteriota bacterium]|nr:PilW family protein [Acidobacteriota bacterium]
MKTMTARAAPDPQAPPISGLSGLPGSCETPGVRRRRRERGFTLMELSVSLLVIVEVILGALMIFDFNSKLARVQEQITDMQQSLRAGQYEMVRMVRMAGRGGLRSTSPARVYPKGSAVEVRNNVGIGSPAPPDDVAVGYASSPRAVDGTDILTVRGVFTAPIYQVNSAQAASFTLFDATNNPTTNPAVAVRGVAQVCNLAPSGVNQTLTPLTTAITAAVPEALLIVSPLDDSVSAVVELDAANSTTVPAVSTLCPTTGKAIQIGFKVVGGTYTASYQKLSNVSVDGAGNPTQNLPPALTSALFLGVLEEYRYYVRQNYAVPGNTASAPMPRLSRARMFPGTEVPYLADVNNAQVDIADNVMDLQIALGLDLNGDGVIAEDTPPTATDEWLYNSSADLATDPRWLTVAGSAPARQPRMFYVRITQLVRTDRRDFQYAAPVLTNIEDHTYPASPAGDNSPQNRMFRRRLLQTVVDLRNL